MIIHVLVLYICFHVLYTLSLLLDKHLGVEWLVHLYFLRNWKSFLQVVITFSVTYQQCMKAPVVFYLLKYLAWSVIFNFSQCQIRIIVSHCGFKIIWRQDLTGPWSPPAGWWTSIPHSKRWHLLLPPMWPFLKHLDFNSSVETSLIHMELSHFTWLKINSVHFKWHLILKLKH